MSTIQGKPREEVFNQSARIKYLRIALLLVGVTFIFGIYALTLAWPSGCLCDAGDLPLDRQSQTSGKLEPHLVHGMVQRGTRCSHDSAGSREPRRHRASLG
jgi:hypothetical protein